MHEKIIIFDFGGQYAHLIASRIRRENVLAEIYNPDEVGVEFLKDKKVKGIILSGGPQSVFDEDSPKCDNEIFNLGIPVLGICYGHQYLNHNLGGEVKKGKVHEFGRVLLTFDTNCPLFQGFEMQSEKFGKQNIIKTCVWMSHGDEVVKLAKGFETIGSTDTCRNAAVWNKEKNLFGIQFHPEVTHTKLGNQVLKNFLDICEVSYDWSIEKFLEEETEVLKKKIGDRNVFLFVSGGVDSTVAFAFLSKVLGGGRVKGLFINTGLLRKGEVEVVKSSLEKIGTHLTVLEREETFLRNLENVYDPEKKREIIGNTFLEVQHEFFSENELHEDWVLAQGTIYPDTIETGGTKHAATIKTHHNRVPEIQKLIEEGKVIEPIAELYKDEVRALGELLGLPHSLVWRHPFPGPGLGVRILCAELDIEDHRNSSLQNLGDNILLPIKSVGVQGDYRTYRHPAVLGPEGESSSFRLQEKNFDIEKLEFQATELINKNPEVNRAMILLGQNFQGKIKICSVHKCSVIPERVIRLQVADNIVTKTLEHMKLYDEIWQFPVILVPLSFNGCGKESIVLRPVDSIDAMSASVGKLPAGFFERVAKEILKDKNISAVFLDVTSKPPGTIEWE